MKRPNVNRPLILAHRGACRVAPENTLPAFQAAVDLGADGVELDVQYSSDGKLVIFHNPTLEATTDGAGRVTSHTFDDLRSLDAGAKFDPRFAGTRIPTLDEVLDLLAGKALVNIEIKALDLTGASLGADIVAAVRAHGMADQVMLSSFNPFALRRARQVGPEIEGGLLIAPDLPAWMRWNVTRRISRANAIHPEHPMVDAAYLAWARRLGLPVRVWTVNDEADMRRMIALGVDAIITDVPDVTLALL
ncbi:MAG: glycerophosphodiester phosphodiesterase family protein [Chloroflexi bacterium]|nr:glycerophosphodiester phosphodiesterase family protein [Chloroflexota bacterium]